MNKMKTSPGLSFAAPISLRRIIMTFVVLYFATIRPGCSVAAPAECSNIPNGRSCSLNSNAESVAVLEDRVLVGATDQLLSFGRDLSLQESVAIDPQPDKFQRCTGFGPDGLSNPTSECRNFIKVIQQVPSGHETNAVDQGQIMVCGTNAFFPKCTIHESSSLTNYSFMTTEEDDEGYSPHAQKDPIVAVLTSNGRFFSATLFQAFQPHRTIGMAKDPLGGESLFNVRAPISDRLWFNKPTFISTYEIGDHIYFFMREPAYEVDNGQSIVYSRAVRICKSDEGQTAVSGSSTTPFLTYQKARMTCSYDGERGSIPYNYDNLESTFLWNGSGQALTLYGVFSSPDNGPEGSAICKFSFDPTVEGSLTKVFEDGQYITRQSQNGQVVWISEEPGPFSCPGDTSGVQRTVEQARQYQLIDGTVEAKDPEPLHIVSGDKLDKIAVDVVLYNNTVQEVVYFTTEDGELRQVVYIGSSGTEEHVIRDLGSAVNHLSVHKRQDDSRQVYATTEDQIMTISRGNCTQYSGCFGCLDSKDAYCGWSPGMHKCLNKISQFTSDLIEAHSASEEKTVMTCGTRPYVPDPTPVTPTTTTCPYTPKPTNGATAGTNGNSPCLPNTEGLSNGNGDSSQSDKDVPTIVGATVGAFVLGVPVGAFVCFIFFRLFVRPRQVKNYLEEETAGGNGGTRDTFSNGSTRMSNVPTSEPVEELSRQNQQKKIDLSLSTESHNSLHNPAPPRYVDVKPKSHLSCSAPSNGSAFMSGSASMEMMFKRNSVEVGSTMMTNVNSKDDCAFTGSENDIVPPLVHLTGNDGFGTYKKPSKQNSKFPKGTNGVSRTQVPGHKVPKGRTPSTTWLRENSVSDGSDLSSPLQSPISDV